MVAVVLIDRRQAVLLAASCTRGRSVQLEEVERLDEVWEEREHQRLAPSLDPHRGSHTDAGGLERERRRRFGQRAAEWLVGQVRSRGIERVTVFCAPAMLHDVRDRLPLSMVGRVDIRRGDLAGKPLAALRDHPALKGTLEEGAG